MSELRLRSLEARKHDLDLITRAFALNGSEREPSLVRWQHEANPGGQPVVEIAESPTSDPPAVAGVYATLRAKFRAHGQLREGVQSIDTLTDSRFRGQGIFRQLAEKTYSRCVEEGVSLVYGFPNGSSAHAFFNRLDWTCLDPVPFRFRPLRSKYFFDRIPGLRGISSVLPNFSLLGPGYHNASKTIGISQRDKPQFGPEHTELWNCFAGDDTIGVDRSADYLTWRFSKPGESYQMAEFREDGRLLGYVVWTVKEKHQGRIGYIMELLFDTKTPKVGQVLLEHATSAIARADADAVLAWNFSHSANHAAYRACRYLHLPLRLRPIELHFGVRSFNEDLNITERNRWYLSYCDSDTV